MRPIRAVLALSLCLTMAARAAAQGPVAPVQGVVLDNRTGLGAPGLTASLIHPQLGRSAPSLTDAAGHFEWGAIPVQPEPYYLEIYWGSNLIYRQQVVVQGPVKLPELRL
jgi:hypothetical protein